MALTNGLYFFYFHDVSDDEYIPNKIRTHPKRYFKELDYICRNFEVIPVSLALERLRTVLTTGIEWQRPTAVVCFDDGFSSFRTMALPKLIELRCPVALFVNGAFCTQEVVSEALLAEAIEANWSRDQIKELFPDYEFNEPFSAFTLKRSCRAQFDSLNAAAGADVLSERPYLSFDNLLDMPEDLVTIGNHTYRHLFLSNLSAEEQEAEIVINHNALKYLPAYRPIICLPFGSNNSFNDNTCKLIRRHGDGILMKAVGGTTHRLSGDIIEIERIGLNNNKLPIKYHIRQRTGDKVVFPAAWQRAKNRLSRTLKSF